MRASLQSVRPGESRGELAYAEAAKLCDAEVAACEAIATHGETLIKAAYKGSKPVNVLTHCNAGWLAAVDWGMSLAPVYRAHDAGIPVHVWVDETRPRNQGAALTAWELHRHGVPHTVIVDNAGGHLMQHGMVDLCIVGSDRVAANGDVCNKIGTYLKALAAHDNGVPFYAALPSSTIDWSLADGGRIPIEQRSAGEVTHMQGLSASGEIVEVRTDARGQPRRQLRLRRHPRASGDRDHHRARRLFSRSRGPRLAVPRSRQGCLSVENLWSDADAADLVRHYAQQGVAEDLALRVYTSRLLGREPRLVQHGGGNTSLKSTAKDVLGAPIAVLHVKGSGWDLGDIEPPGLPAVRLEPLQALRTLEHLSDEDMVEAQRGALMLSSAPNPSVETLLHAWISPTVVDHTHANAVLALTDQPNGEAVCRDLYGERLAISPYVMPGFSLAHAAARTFEAHPDAEGMILLKHGIFTWGDTARAIL